MKRIIFLLIAIATQAGVAAFSEPASRHTAQEATPIFVTQIPQDTVTGRWSQWPTKQVTSTIFVLFWGTT